jgi:hypothetical protein
MFETDAPIACTLSPETFKARMAELGQLTRDALRSSRSLLKKQLSLRLL